MKQATLLTATLIACSTLMACSQSPMPSASPAVATTADPDAPKTFIGRHVDQALEEARKELATENISIGDGFNMDINGHKIHHSHHGLPKAEITPQGDLLVEGKAVDITPTQRQQLLAYRGQIIGIAEAGMAIGAKGADIAGEAMNGVVGLIFGGKDGEKAFEQRMEAQGEKIEAEAMKLCARLPALLAGQKALAASLPEFKPYARMTQEDIEDCSKDDEHGGLAATTR